MRRSFLLAGIGLATCVAGAAFADDGAPPVPAAGNMAMKHTMPLPSLPKTRAEVQAQVRAHFADLDRNHDGYLTADELPQPAMHAMHTMAGGKPDKAMLDHMFAMMDRNGDRQISRSEFESFHTAPMPMHAAGDGNAAHPAPPPTASHAMRGMMAAMLFRHADADHDGKISLAEAEAAALVHFDKLDTNHDGVLSEDERAAARNRMVMRFHHRMGAGHGDMPPPPPPPAPPSQG